MSTALPLVPHSASALDASVLVLNRLFMAVRVVRARHAFVPLWKQTAEVVSVEDESFATYDFTSWTEVSAYRRQFEPAKHDWVHTVRFEIAVPRVIRLLSYDRLPKTRVRLNRRNLFARDSNRCQYFGKRFRTRVHEVQRPQRRPHARRGRDAPHPRAGPAALQPRDLAARRQREVPLVETVPRRRVLAR